LGVDTTLKNLRHYSATELIIGGVDIRTVAGRLGHSGGGTTTLKVYAAWVAAADQLASDVVLNRMPYRPSSAPGDLTDLAPRKVHERLAADLYADWLSGELAPGTELTVKGLMRTHEVTNHAAYRTVRHLREKGVLEVRNGHRSVVLPCCDTSGEHSSASEAPLAPERPAPAQVSVAAQEVKEPTPVSAASTGPAAANREAVDLEVVRLGQSVRTYRTDADPNDTDELLELLLDAVRRTGGTESDVRDYELVVRYAGERGVVTTFVVPLPVARALEGAAA
jgi:hypothetical protein